MIYWIILKGCHSVGLCASHPFTQHYEWPTLIARFMKPTWGPPGADRTRDGPHVGPMSLAIWEVSIPLVKLTTDSKVVNNIIKWVWISWKPIFQSQWKNVRRVALCQYKHDSIMIRSIWNGMQTNIFPFDLKFNGNIVSGMGPSHVTHFLPSFLSSASSIYIHDSLRPSDAYMRQ